MAGPTPVSALIHAATMVTAGVYLIARTHTLFSLAPPVELLVAVIGVLTLLIGGFSALAQHDLKRILAYSTMSQIGYMFLALGVGAWSAAIFHLVTHAFFKALLFLAAGVVILNVHDDHDIFHMGGLARKMPLVFWTFLIGALALAAFPLLTAGFYSKDLIIEDAWASAYGSHWLWAGAWLGAFVTALYTYRMVFLVFFGPEHTAPAVRQDAVMNIPLLVLALFTLCAGLLELPQLLVKHPLFSAFLQPMLRDAALTHGGSSMELLLMDLSIAASLGGLLLAYLLYLRRPVEQRSTPLSRVLLAGFGFDLLYTQVFVRPYLWFARVNKHDVIDIFYWALAHMGIAYHQLLQQPANRQSALVCHGSRHRRADHHRDSGVVMILVWLILLPLLGGVLSWLLSLRSLRAARWTALLAMLLQFALAIGLWVRYQGAMAQMLTGRSSWLLTSNIRGCRKSASACTWHWMASACCWCCSPG